ncbi:MAG: hypothetical protein ACREMI_06065, partial [Gemmatimonadales bacterium]
DREVVLLQEIRDLLQRSVANQEHVLRANDEAMRLYRTAARRQLLGILTAVGLLVVLFLLAFRVMAR